MQASDLTEPIHSVLDRIPVQEIVDRVPSDILEYVPDRFLPQEETHRSRWVLLILVAAGVLAAAMLMKRRRNAMPEDDADLDLRERQVIGEVSVIEQG